MSNAEIQQIVAGAVAAAIANGGTKAAEVKATTPKSKGYKAMVEWTHQAIKALRAKEGGKYKGVHAVYSGFNRALGTKMGMTPEQVREATQLMVNNGDIQVRPSKGGPIFYLPGDLKTVKRDDADTLVSLIDGFKG